MSCIVGIFASPRLSVVMRPSSACSPSIRAYPRHLRTIGRHLRLRRRGGHLPDDGMAERGDGACRQLVEGYTVLRGVVHEDAPVPKHDAFLRPDVELRRQMGELAPYVLGRAEGGMGCPHTGAGAR